MKARNPHAYAYLLISKKLSLHHAGIVDKFLKLAHFKANIETRGTRRARDAVHGAQRPWKDGPEAAVEALPGERMKADLYKNVMNDLDTTRIP